MDLLFQKSFGEKKLRTKFGANWALIWRLVARTNSLTEDRRDLGPSAS